MKTIATSDDFFAVREPKDAIKEAQR
jgi:hypothetical protein